ncbi:MAG TPA: HEAT repeat domain-containing protein, partial [Planctomycetota bacterium]|nr:HEAT repeat domain-containing protein [Planctomycetota bacterium]
ALTRLRLLERVGVMIDDPDASVRRAAIAGIAQEAAPERVRELAGKIADPDPGVRRIAVEAVARLGGREYADALARALADTQPEVVFEALWALRESGSAKQGPAVAPLLKHEWPSVRRVAAIALANWNYAEALPQLRAAAEKEPDADTRAVMWSVLKTLGADREY